MDLEPLEYLQGTMSTLLIVISAMVAIKFFLRYREFHTKESILVGLTWIGLVSPWIPDVISFIMVFTVGYPLTVTAVYLIGYAPIPIYILCWFMALSESLYKEKKKIIMIITAIFCTVFEIIFLILLFSDVSLLGERIATFHMRHNTFMMIYLICLIVIVLVTGVLFSKVAFVSNNREVNLKGKFLLIAFISFTVGAIIEAVVHITPPLVIITKSILISSAIFFYLGFALPERVKKLFLRKNEMRE